MFLNLYMHPMPATDRPADVTARWPEAGLPVVVEAASHAARRGCTDNRKAPPPPRVMR